MAGVLEGIRVIDLAQQLAGPGSSMYLADQGADVIKIEPPGKGDGSRGQNSDPILGNNSRSFLVLNRNKRSVALDLRKPEAKDVLHKLVQRADVLITNMRLSATQKLCVDYPALQKVNPRLIYAGITAFGTKGPYAGKGGYDRLTQGLSGAMYRKWEDGTPVTAGVWLSDPTVPMLIAYGVMLALWQREKTGAGQEVETSLLQAAIAMQNTSLVAVERSETPLVEFESATYGIYKCSDGAYINITALQPYHFVNMCKLLQLEHLADDMRWRDPATRNEFRNEVYPIIEALFTTKPSREWLKLLDEHDVPAAPIVERPQVFSEPQMVANDMFVRVDHPQVGPVQMFAPPVRLANNPPVAVRPSPGLGEHTEDVLRELGYSADGIAGLRAAGAI